MMSEWISVKDRLPGINQTVLYIPANNPRTVQIGKLTAIGRCGGVCFTPCVSDHPCNFYARYWMPLPELPKEESQCPAKSRLS